MPAEDLWIIIASKPCPMAKARPCTRGANPWPPAGMAIRPRPCTCGTNQLGDRLAAGLVPNR